jgi:hypothetical protein
MIFFFHKTKILSFQSKKIVFIEEKKICFFLNKIFFFWEKRIFFFQKKSQAKDPKREIPSQRPKQRSQAKLLKILVMATLVKSCFYIFIFVDSTFAAQGMDS